MKFDKFRELKKKNHTVSAVFEKSSEFCSDPSAMRREANKIEACGDYIRTNDCLDCGTHHFAGYQRCKSKYCYTCNRVKSAIWTAKLYDYAKQWLGSGKYVVFLNLTIRDRESLSEGINLLEKSFSSLSGGDSRLRKIFRSSFLGGFRSLEVKLGERSGLWHPHLHLLCFKDRKSSDTYFLNYAWRKCLIKNGASSDEGIYKIMSFAPRRGCDRDTYEQKLLKSIREVAKYMTKVDFSVEDPQRVAELYDTLKGRRQYSTWGVLFDVKKQVDGILSGDMAVNQVKDFVCQVCGCTESEPNSLHKIIWQDELIVDQDEPLQLGANAVQAIKTHNGKLPPEVPPEKIKYHQTSINVWNDGGN